MSALAAARRYRSLVDRLGAIVWEAIPGDRPGEATFTFVSEATDVLLGYSAERWLADRTFWFEMIHPDDRDEVNAEMVAAAHQRAGADFEYRVIAADGRVVWLRNIAQPDDHSEGFRFTGVLIDVTQRHAADRRLHRLRELTDALSGILTAREVAAIVAARGRSAVGAAAVGVFLRVGTELELCGYDGYPEEMIAAVCRIPLDRDTPAAEAVRTGEAIVLSAAELEARYPSLGGWRKLAGAGHFAVLPLVAGDRVLGSLALRLADDRPVEPEDRLVLDVLTRASVSALLRAEHSSAETDARAVTDAIIATAPEGFALFDTELRYVRVNDALAEINGVPAAAHPGRRLREIAPGISAEDHEAPLRQVLASGEPVVDLEVTGRTAADPHVDHTWLVSYYPVHGAGESIAWLGSFVVDITARKRAEERSVLLSELGAILDEAEPVERRLEHLVRALVPVLWDSCAVALGNPDGELEIVASRGRAEPDVVLGLSAAGRAFGHLALGAAGGLDLDELAFAREVAHRTAVAIDTARLRERERAARDRTERQYAVAAALADALTSGDVAAAALAEVVPAVGADHGTVWQISEDGAALEAIGWRGFRDEEMVGHLRNALSERRPVAESIRARRPLSWGDSAELDAAFPALAEGLRARRLLSAAAFPLLSAGRVVGGLFLSCERPHALGPDDLALAAALAAQTAQALERARLFETERRVSVTLQRSLLPEKLAQVAGVELELRYLPAAGLEAGGDFYETLPLPDGTLLLAVGDVVGRGAKAAAAMGQLRSALRAFALVGESPGGILGHLSSFSETVGGASASTAVVATLDPDGGSLRYACAGHPHPLLVRPDGTAEYLRDGRGVPLGCVADPVYPEATVQLDPGSSLLLYTDGLTERRGQDLDAALERLRSATAACALQPLDALLDCAVAGVGESAPADDVAVLAVRVTG